MTTPLNLTARAKDAALTGFTLTQAIGEVRVSAERIAPLDEAKIRLRTVVRQKQRGYSPIEWVGLEDVALVLDAIEATARITEARAEGYNAGSHAHRSLALSAIFLADTFDKDVDPDVEIRAMRDEWVRDARATAWDEGYLAADNGEDETNPYRKETT